MDATEYTDRYKQINRQVTRHRFWLAAMRDSYGRPWVGGVVDRLLILADGEPVDYLETVGDLEGDRTVKTIAFTASRRLTVEGTYRSSAPGPEAAVSAKSRDGLAEVEVLRAFEWGIDAWPHGLTLRLRYSDGDTITLGESGGSTTDEDAPGRLAAFYPELLRDLDRVGVRDEVARWGHERRRIESGAPSGSFVHPPGLEPGTH